MLEFDGVELSFAGVKAIDGVSFTVGGNELFAIIGPNGAGKTSIFNVLSGVYRPQAGRVTFEGIDLVGKRPDGSHSSELPAPSKTSSCSPI